jgi:DnaJ-class molecular chaperone
MTQKRKYKDGSYEVDCDACLGTGMQVGCTWNNPRVCPKCNGHAVLYWLYVEQSARMSKVQRSCGVVGAERCPNGIHDIRARTDHS